MAQNLLAILLRGYGADLTAALEDRILDLIEAALPVTSSRMRKQSPNAARKTEAIAAISKSFLSGREGRHVRWRDTVLSVLEETSGVAVRNLPATRHSVLASLDVLLTIRFSSPVGQRASTPARAAQTSRQSLLCRILNAMNNFANAPIRIGSRGSQLALWQANHVLYALRDAGYAVELEIIRTTGDRMQQPGFVAPPGLDGKGIFIKEIEEALEQGRIDLAVHSLKDLPTRLAPQFSLAAIPKRADARDVWVCEASWALHMLSAGGRIGTTSPRRRAQILALRPDVTFVDVRGNIDTRLRKLEQGQCDALVLAAAGLDRLKRTESVHQRFSPRELCPAPGQGALAIETRSPEYSASIRSGRDRDPFIRSAVAFLEHPHTRFAVDAERTTLHALGGGCELPIGAYCFFEDGRWHIIAQVVAPDGEAMVQVETAVGAESDPAALGVHVADELKARGAMNLLTETFA